MQDIGVSDATVKLWILYGYIKHIKLNDQCALRFVMQNIMSTAAANRLYWWTTGNESTNTSLLCSLFYDGNLSSSYTLLSEAPYQCYPV